MHGDDLNLDEEPKAKKRANNPFFKYSADPQFNEFLKVRGVETTKDDNDEDQSSAQVLLDALEEYRGGFKALVAN